MIFRFTFIIHVVEEQIMLDFFHFMAKILVIQDIQDFL